MNPETREQTIHRLAELLRCYFGQNHIALEPTLDAAYDAGRSSQKQQVPSAQECCADGANSNKENSRVVNNPEQTAPQFSEPNASYPYFPLTRDGFTTCAHCGCWIAQRDGKWIRVEVYPVPNCAGHEWGAHEPVSGEKAPTNHAGAFTTMLPTTNERPNETLGESILSLSQTAGNVSGLKEMSKMREIPETSAQPMATQGRCSICDKEYKDCEHGI